MDAIQHGDHDRHNPGCMLCGLNKPFVLPEEIITEALKGSIVIFAGAGISTEVPAVLETNIYSTIKSKISDPASDEFPDVMSRYVATYGRTKFVEEVWHRFDYIRAFSELRRTATRFHRELATMPYIKEIITTNWDPYFEDECGAIPIVTGADYSLRNLDARRVYKIHGSINAISTLVATREDYDRCLADLGGNALGATLRHLLATQTVIFIGYSLTDTDFRLIYEALTADLGEFAPTRYYVGPFESQQAQEFNMKQIATDGTYFLTKLKEAAVSRSNYLPDSIYDQVDEFALEVSEASQQLDKFDHTKIPGILFAYLYQQGARHACDRISANRIRGEASDGHTILHKAHSYKQLFDGAIRNEMWGDAAYIDGYLNTHLLVLAAGESPQPDDADDDPPTPPPFFCFSTRDLYTIEELEKSAKNLRRRNKPAWEFAKKMSDQAGPDYIPQHGITLDIDRLMS